MEEFNSIESVTELFRRINCVGEENCFFISYVNNNMGDASMIGGILGGAIGGAIGAAIDSKNNATIFNCKGFLVNQTEKGIALIALDYNGISWSNPIKKMKAQVDSYMFIEQEDIEKVIIKNANLISAVTKNVTIILKNTTRINLMVNKKEKYIPYHEENFARFMSKYKK